MIGATRADYPYQRHLWVRHVSIGKVVNVALGFSMPHKDDPPWKDAVVLRSCTPAYHHSVSMSKTYVI